MIASNDIEILASNDVEWMNDWPLHRCVRSYVCGCVLHR